MSVKIKEGITCLKQIPKAKKIIQKHFSAIEGVIEVTVIVKLVNRIVVYVYLDEKIYTQRFDDKQDRVRLIDVGIEPKDKKSKKRFPRILLEIMKAQMVSKSEVSEVYPQLLKIDWVAFLKAPGSREVTPIDIM